ncbi:hypothetical protein, partial [Mycoplasmopsis bovis]|uniref:hypothetical protein n=1 Tax=Mycoplasmopsis bovis TaxID=28903 RepID=UPI003D28EEB0
SGQGVSQNNTLNPEYLLDLSNEKWYVFNDNYGTTEEKAFLKYFKQEIASILDNYNLEYYVVRNKRKSGSNRSPYSKENIASSLNLSFLTT